MKALTIAAMLTLLPGAALAQQQTIYGPDGKVAARVATDSAGSKTIYGADGRISGRTATDSQGTTVIYDAAGRKTAAYRQEQVMKYTVLLIASILFCKTLWILDATSMSIYWVARPRMATS